MSELRDSLKTKLKIVKTCDTCIQLSSGDKVHTVAYCKQYDEEFPLDTNFSKCVCNLHTDEAKLKTLIEKNYELKR